MHEFENLARYLGPRLLASVGEEGGGDGGGGGGGSGDDKDKKPVTAADVQAMIDKSVGKSVNAAVTTHLKRALGGDDFKASLGEVLKSTLPDILKGAKPAGGEDDPDDGGDPPDDKAKGKKGGKGGDDGVPPDVRRRLDQLEKQVKQRDDELAKEKAAREAEKKERETAEEKSALTKALTDSGLAPKRVKAAVALLYGEEKRVIRGEKGQLFFKLEDEDGDEVEYSLADGVKRWVASDVGQDFLPAKPVAGSGNTGGERKPTKQGDAPALESVIGLIMGGPTS